MRSEQDGDAGDGGFEDVVSPHGNQAPAHERDRGDRVEYRELADRVHEKDVDRRSASRLIREAPDRIACRPDELFDAIDTLRVSWSQDQQEIGMFAARLGERAKHELVFPAPG